MGRLICSGSPRILRSLAVILLAAMAVLGGDDPAEGSKGGQDPPDITALLNTKFADWEAAQKKAADEAKKLEGMNAQQKADLELEKMKDQLEEFQKKDALSEMTKVARKMLADEKISVADELLSMMVTDNAEDTEKAVEGFSKAFSAAVEAEVKKRMKGETPTKGGGKTIMTKEEIMKIQDPELRQKKILENREVFNF
ncbi:DUF4355 domain-containing protein [Eubacterium aggregans]|uniref:DUF4355 domain-containing protein n=1 Tax=Eubacterium aggregans TaxID=81409 RepID=UPI003F2E6CC1